VHQIVIAQNGTMLLENVNAEEAVRDRVYEGLFTLGPSRITGGVQAIINPRSSRIRAFKESGYRTF
jgi:hypothetical protein